MRKVTMYTTSTCPYCNGAKQLLDSKGIPYTETNVGTQNIKQEMVKRSSRRTVPEIFIGTAMSEVTTIWPNSSAKADWPKLSSRIQQDEQTVVISFTSPAPGGHRPPCSAQGLRNKSTPLPAPASRRASSDSAPAR